MEQTSSTSFGQLVRFMVIVTLKTLKSPKQCMITIIDIKTKNYKESNFAVLLYVCNQVTVYEPGIFHQVKF
jgi:hypothetical protein